jgi:hypothetical protein
MQDLLEDRAQRACAKALRERGFGDGEERVARELELRTSAKSFASRPWRARF